MDNIGPDIFGRREERKEEFEIPAMSNAADIKVIGVGGGRQENAVNRND